MKIKLVEIDRELKTKRRTVAKHLDDTDPVWLDNNIADR